ncbi:hypothetical protein [Butyricimonas synergistica]|uniref:hypothetical protein n=1 Tax=Butyricimonas synergistica TaxID=544644 RepID=UPI0003782527|nr:hypothetical protein [Butyricimonas synergistica]
MKPGIQYISSLGIVLIILLSCTHDKESELQEYDLARIDLSIGNEIQLSPESRAQNYSVNRILVLPFPKLNAALPDSRADNFITAWNFARQWDINSFPTQSLTLGLPKSFTYKVLIIGYKQSDYNYYNRNAVSNLIELTSQPTPTSLANFLLAPKSPTIVPEFYTCLCTATKDGTAIGTVFTPDNTSNISLSGQLKRFVSGLTVSITNIPGYVKSIALVAGNLVKAVQVNDTIATAVQVPGDNQSRKLQEQTPSAQTVNFNVFLLPTRSTNKTTFSLIVKYDSVTETYLIKVPDSPVSQNNNIILRPNEIVNISGDYSKINIGFAIGRTIDLDDDKWDGFN